LMLSRQAQAPTPSSSRPCPDSAVPRRFEQGSSAEHGVGPLTTAFKAWFSLVFDTLMFEPVAKWRQRASKGAPQKDA
ncbi:hypothetical protein, partial [Mesorhizobium sp. M7A.F.Ca.US.006.04.2.1]|uniref:hypothetical protein n=1 Tax=Mesorhizobium sp. M7A.F.Ca.US.006.04.2.1 TaxID=2496696 RepID=UPI0019D47671